MRLKFILRKYRLKLGKCFLDKKNTQATPVFPPQSILFLRQDGKIGDYIVSSFVFREIKKQSPQTKIGVVCSAKNAYLFEQNPNIDALYLVKTKDILDYYRCGKKLVAEQYDIVIDPTLTLRNRDLLFLRTIGAKSYIGYQKEDYQLFDRNIPAQSIHYVEIYRQALEIAGFSHINTEYDMPNNAQSSQAVAEFLAEYQLEDYVAVNFFGAGSARRFNEDSMVALLNHLSAQTKSIVLLTFPAVTEKMQALAKRYANVFVFEKTQTVFDTIELIKHSKMVVSPDTAIVHIASGFHKPTVAFYSLDEENFVHWQPNNSAKTQIIRFDKSVNEVDFKQVKADLA